MGIFDRTQPGSEGERKREAKTKREEEGERTDWVLVWLDCNKTKNNKDMLTSESASSRSFAIHYQITLCSHRQYATAKASHQRLTRNIHLVEHLASLRCQLGISSDWVRELRRPTSLDASKSILNYGEPKITIRLAGAMGRHCNRHAHEKQRLSELLGLVALHQLHGIEGKTLLRLHRKLGLGIWTGQVSQVIILVFLFLLCLACCNDVVSAYD